MANQAVQNGAEPKPPLVGDLGWRGVDADGDLVAVSVVAGRAFAWWWGQASDQHGAGWQCATEDAIDIAADIFRQYIEEHVPWTASETSEPAGPIPPECPCIRCGTSAEVQNARKKV